MIGKVLHGVGKAAKGVFGLVAGSDKERKAKKELNNLDTIMEEAEQEKGRWQKVEGYLDAMCTAEDAGTFYDTMEAMKHTRQAVPPSSVVQRNWIIRLSNGA